jgi:hypothetical protein
MINKTTIISTGAMLAMALATTVHAGWQDFLKSTVEELSTNESATQTAASLSNSEIADGLKQALANGVESAVATLGKEGGFLGNSVVQIPLPDSLKMVEKTTRSLGQGEYADQFIAAMNRAAEEAVPESAALLGETIRQMSVADAASIINGPDDAATQYFRKVAGDQLREKFHPIVQNATDQVGVTAAYKSLIAQAAPLLENPLLLRSLMPTDALDVDQYITNQALDGLFKYIALEEKKIRENPAARTTDLLKKVFSSP